MEDLASLRLSLGVRNVRPREGRGSPPPLAAPSLAQEIHAKFAGKTQPESRQLVAILAAVQEVVRAQGLEVTPTAMFAALMARCSRRCCAQAQAHLAGVGCVRYRSACESQRLYPAAAWRSPRHWSAARCWQPCATCCRWCSAVCPTKSCGPSSW